MKGRLNWTLLWRVIVLDAVALFAVLILAYSAGAGAKVPISNMLSLPALRPDDASGFRHLRRRRAGDVVHPG